jgi:adenylate cyclase
VFLSRAAGNPAIKRSVDDTQKPPEIAPDKPSIAVLPFQNMSGDPEQEYFVDGIVEDIVTALSKWRWFFVIARNSSFTYRERSVDVKQIGRELGASYILEGSVRKGDNRVRISVQLVDAVTGAQLWAERYDRDLNDMFAIQDVVTQQVASAIEPALSKNEIAHARQKTQEQMVAWDHYMRGLWHFHQFNEEEAVKSIACFNRALELDENFAEAYAGIARVLLSQMMYGFSPGHDANANMIFATARKALAHDPTNAIACYVLALASAHNDDSTTALKFARNAIELNENFAAGYFALAVTSSFLGRPADALAAIDQALRLSPHDPQTFVWHAQRASALYLLNQYTEALDAARQSLGLKWYHTACRVVAASCAKLEMIEPARAAMRELLASDHSDKSIAQVIRPFKRVADRENYTEGLRKAGMPED